MKKILAVILIVSMLITTIPMASVYAASDVSVLFDFDGFAGGKRTQDASTLTWMGYNDISETPWVSTSLVNSDTWLEPATRTDSVAGTAMRMVTNNGTTRYNANNRYAFVNRPQSHSVSSTHPEIWYRFEWMVEDYNAEHSMRAYLQAQGGANTQMSIFSIDTKGKLSTTAGTTDIKISTGQWHTYEMCMSMTDGLLFYLDGELLNRTSTRYSVQSNWMFMQVLNSTTLNRFKGSAMQFDNFSVTSYRTSQNKRLYGIKNANFSEGDNYSDITFTGTPFNITDTEKDYLMVLNVYDAKGNYVAYHTVSGKQQANAAEIPVSVTVDQWGEGWSAKAYVQHSLTDRTLFSPEIYYWNKETKPMVYVYKNFDADTGGLGGFSIQANSGASLVETGTESYYELSNASDKYVSDIAFSDAANQLVFEVMIKQANPGAELKFYYVDSQNAFDSFLSVNAQGSVTVGKTTIGSLKSGQWNRVAVATDFSAHKMTAWLNDTMMMQNIGRSVNTQLPIKVRIHRPESTQSGKVSIDNLHIYSGTTITNMDEQRYSSLSILGNDYVAKTNLAGKQAVHAYSSQIAVDGIRQMSQTPAFMKDGVIYASEYDLSKMFDVAITATPGANIVYVNSRAVVLADVSVEKDGSTYIPAKELAEKLSMYTLQSDRGILVFAENEFTMDEDTLNEVNDYMQYGRLTPEEVLELLSQNTAHPRTMLSQEQIDVIRSAYLNRDQNFMKHYRYGLYNLFYSGRIVDATTASGSIFWYAIAFVSGWLASHDKTMKEKVWDAVEILCSKPNWDTENDSLCRAHSTIVVAMAYDLLYDEWTDEQLKLMEDCLIEYGLKPIEKVLKGSDSNLTNVFNLGNNINAICASGAIMGATAIWEKEPELASYIIAECMRGMESVASNFYPHGGWDEGADYSAYMMSLLPLGLSTIKNSLGHDYGFLTAPGVQENALFAMSTLGNCGGNNYHDGSDWSAKQANDGVSIAWAAHEYQSPQYYQLRKNYTKLAGITSHPQDILYYHPEWETASVSAVNPLDSYFAGSEFFSMRSSYGKDGIYLSGHFGAESISHSHYDNGTFVLDMLGERWALDLGKDDYNLPGYFVTGTRDQYYRVRPEGHNTFVINPDESLGHTYHGFGRITHFESSDLGSLVIGDMSSVYENCQSAKRGFMLTDDRSSVIIRDEIQTDDPSDIYWFMHTSAEIEIIDNHTAVLSQNGKQIKLSFVSNVANTALSVMDAKPLSTSPNPQGQMTNDGVQKIAIYIPSSESVNLTVRITSADSVHAESQVLDIALDNWTLLDD